MRLSIALALFDDVKTVQALLTDIMPDIEVWMNHWGRYEMILSSDFDKISKMFSAVPLLWKKQFFLLKSYGALSMGDYSGANDYFPAYRNENSDMDFSLVDNYISSLIVSNLPGK